jgi:hypothetical protein
MLLVKYSLKKIKEKLGKKYGAIPELHLSAEEEAEEEMLMESTDLHALNTVMLVAFYKQYNPPRATKQHAVELVEKVNVLSSEPVLFVSSPYSA